MIGASFNIRPLVEADLAEVLALWKECPGVGLTEEDTPEVLAGFLDRNQGLSQVAIDSGHVVGAVLCGHDGRRGMLYHLAVAANARRSGVGGALVARCHEALRAAGIRKCNLVVYARNAGGRAFWDHAGFFSRPDLVFLQRFT